MSATRRYPPNRVTTSGAGRLIIQPMRRRTFLFRVRQFLVRVQVAIIRFQDRLRDAA